ncbi:dephospho-CoA kinase [Enterococcus phoeniculicola]|jgi:dephospho-CoA kinase|uniref:Dephospho-CoA kinase n=1 Tax=Enterococcus phoeniculicola ATCC BAA-412 TaxID=1158610 RepID=R3TY45_9ENTE|nr:dephospho-CoA kinase [Enterococcus phoeniculicola]EOL46058.1 dephospho-CoA kinase [Enterococcus phoeniculicola ATCC BAA-412]EOT77097.1 dephospho-CoA kinase [Enterococcus phoeniculicola ATCC BAA-412]
MSFILGITGGISTGKSSVVAVFKELGYPIVDADIVARQVVEPQTPGLNAIVEVFGNEIITEDGHLNRKKLGSIIFQSDEKRQQLNQLLNPFIRSEIVAQIEEKKKLASLVIVDIPLLFEGHYEQYMTQVAVVYIPEVLQLQRLMKRDHLNEEDALKRIHSQLDIEEKKKRADIVFDNQGSQEKTREQVMAWLSKFK